MSEGGREGGKERGWHKNVCWFCSLREYDEIGKKEEEGEEEAKM